MFSQQEFRLFEISNWNFQYLDCQSNHCLIFLSIYWPNKTSAICFSDICQSSEKDIEIAYVEYIVDKSFFFVFQIIGIPI